jgi:phage terminase large subunit
MGVMTVEFPQALEFLFTPARTKVAYGGRGSSKSWSIARALLVQAAAKPLRILCAREIQRSMKDSVHKLLADQVVELGLEGFFEVQNDSIRGRNGSEFIFAGLRFNIDNIKSKEGLDRCWVEEAQTVSKSSWDKLIPTIRKPDSEVWISFNPELESDETYQRFVANAPAGALVRKVNYTDNPWFPEVLRAELEALKARDYDDYLTIWEGHCRQSLSGAIYANELRKATANGQFTRVPYDESKPVNTYWDLGRADMTSIWFVQTVGFEHRVIDFVEDRGRALNHYLRILQNKGYVWGAHHLPHDARYELLASDKTIERQMQDAGFSVRIVPKLRVADGINAVRSIFSRCYFDNERCADGLNSLRRYRFRVDEQTGQWSKEPNHDAFSHASDAFRYFATSVLELGTDNWNKPLKADIGWVA